MTLLHRKIRPSFLTVNDGFLLNGFSISTSDHQIWNLIIPFMIGMNLQ